MQGVAAGLNHQPWEGNRMRTVIAIATIVMLLGGGVLADDFSEIPRSLVQIESRPGIFTRMIVYRPEHPLAAVILFPDGSGRLEITHVFNTPHIGRSGDVPWGVMHHLLRKNMMVVLMDAPTDHNSILGINGWDGPRIFRLSRDHARDIGAAVDYLKQRDPMPVWLAGIRMGAFSAATAAIHLQQEVAGLVIAGGITQCPEQKALLQLCPDGLMGLPLHEITVPTLILSGRDAFPESLLTSALSRSSAISYQTYPEFAAFETKEWEPEGVTLLSGLSDAHLSREMADFIAWDQRIHPLLIALPGPVEMAPVELYLAGITF